MQIPQRRKETMFIQMLEGLHQEEAELLIGVKEKSLNKKYKGLTAALVKEHTIGTTILCKTRTLSREHLV
jgi:hypothetical protein